MNYFPLLLFSFFITFSSIFVFISLFYNFLSPKPVQSTPTLSFSPLHCPHTALFTLLCPCAGHPHRHQLKIIHTDLHTISESHNTSNVTKATDFAVQGSVIFGSYWETGGVVARFSAGGRDPPLLWRPELPHKGYRECALGLESDHGTPINAQAKKECSCNSKPTHVFMARTGKTLPLNNKSCGTWRRDVRGAVSAILKVRTAVALEGRKLFFGFNTWN